MGFRQPRYARGEKRVRLSASKDVRCLNIVTAISAAAPACLCREITGNGRGDDPAKSEYP